MTTSPPQGNSEAPLKDWKEVADALPPSTLIVIGSPDPGQGFKRQFVTAAKYLRGGAETMWLVERSGYEFASVSLDFAIDAPPGGYRWISEDDDLVSWINMAPAQSIKKLVVFSHGLPGLVCLRHGWRQGGDYGLSISDVAQISPSSFASDAQIVLNSCNSASVESELVPDEAGGVRIDVTGDTSTALALVKRLHCRVSAWTGRTSYHAINRGTCEVRPSSFSDLRDFPKEARARLLGRTPAFVTYSRAGVEESRADRWSL